MSLTAGLGEIRTPSPAVGTAEAFTHTEEEKKRETRARLAGEQVAANLTFKHSVAEDLLAQPRSRFSVDGFVTHEVSSNRRRRDSNCYKNSWRGVW